MIKCWVWQRVFGFNRTTYWPVHWSSKIICPEKVDCGTRSPGLGMGCHIDGRNGIVFEENVWVGPRVSIISMNHSIENYLEYLPSNPIRIRKNCWLGANAVLLPGVNIGEHTIVAAGTVVTKSFPEGNQILGGVPAMVIKKIGPYINT